MEGDWLVALQQDSGKGRQGRTWVSESGNFFGSTLVRRRPGDPPATALALAAGLALIEAVDVAAPDRSLTLKWPNDLLLGDAKLAGILLERSDDRIVAGFGVNLARAPEVEGRKTASLNGIITPQAFAPLLAGSFARILSAWRNFSPADFARAWCERAHPIGTALAVHSDPGQSLHGRFAGIDEDGTLLLLTANGDTVRVRAGDVSVGQHGNSAK